MILEMDCGNTLLKWRLLGDAGEVVLKGSADACESVLHALEMANKQIAFVRLVSVRSDEETAQLVSELSAALSLDVSVARSEPGLAGVINGYLEPERLGVDRWLALVAGYQLAPEGCLVLDLGTAITSDFVSADGRHLGGFICPGLGLMREQLQGRTRRIRYQATPLSVDDMNEPGKLTADAVERGCAQMLRAFVVDQLRLAQQLLGVKMQVFLTGGDAYLVSDLCPNAKHVDDLVFRGLALACPAIKE